MKLKLTKGKLSKEIAFSTSGTAPPIPKSIPITPYKIFECSIDRAEHLLRIHEKAYGSNSEPSDAHRAAIVLAVAALDAFIRTLVIENIRTKIADQNQQVPPKLKEQAKGLLGLDGLFEAARDGDLGSRLEKGFRQQFEEKSFQGINNIQEALHLIGLENVFHTIADAAAINEDHLKSDLGRFTKRRHIIAHCGDYDLTQTPPIEKNIEKDHAEKCIKVVRLVATEIQKLCKL